MNKKIEDERLQSILNSMKANGNISDRELVNDCFYEEEENCFFEPEEDMLFEPFSMKDDIKDTHFDDDGNLVPNPDDDDDLEEDIEEEENLVDFDIECALESLEYLINVLKNNSTISDAITEFYNHGEDEIGNEVTNNVSNLMFMGMTKIYQYNRKQLLKKYNKLSHS